MNMPWKSSASKFDGVIARLCATYSSAASGSPVAWASLPRLARARLAAGGGGGLAATTWHSRYPISPYHISIHIHPFSEGQATYTSPLSGPIDMQFFVFPEVAGSLMPHLVATGGGREGAPSASAAEVTPPPDKGAGQ